MIFNPYSDLLITLIRAYKRGTDHQKWVMNSIFIMMVIAIVLATLAEAFHVYPKQLNTISGFFGAISALFLFIIFIQQKETEKHQKQESIQRAVDFAVNNPKEIRAGWEVSYQRLETYMENNLVQVRSIFRITVVVMLTGFVLISAGVIILYGSEHHLRAAVLSSISGVLVSFIGATFMVIYKSTMQQARDYITILERVNAIGMASQLIDSIEKSETKLRSESLAKLSHELLSLYHSNSISKSNTRI